MNKLKEQVTLLVDLEVFLGLEDNKEDEVLRICLEILKTFLIWEGNRDQLKDKIFMLQLILTSWIL